MHTRLPLLSGGNDIPPGARKSPMCSTLSVGGFMRTPALTKYLFARSLSVTIRDSGELTDKLLSWTDDKKVSLSLPSLRVDSFTKELMEKISTVRTSGITFAPEAGTQRMRDVINKNVHEEELLVLARTHSSAERIRSSSILWTACLPKRARMSRVSRSSRKRSSIHIIQTRM